MTALKADATRAALDPDALMRAATQDTGLDDFGDEEFAEPLQRYCNALIDEARLNAGGVQMMHQIIVGYLTTRLRLQDDLQKHPEILDEVIVPPIVIAGLPRTGTTKLQRMLSKDPQVQSTTFWRTVNPAPFPGWKPGDPDPRVAVGEAIAAGFRAASPELAAAHYTDAHEADEDARLMMMSLEHIGNAVWVQGVPSYMSWVTSRSQRNAYEHLHLLLRYLQWQDGGGRGRPWVLKTPMHLGNSDLVAETFPSATVVHTYRDPVIVIASTVRIFETLWRITSDEVDLSRLGETMLEYWSGQMVKAIAQRDELGSRVQFLDVPYEAVRDRALAVVRDLYELRGEPLTTTAAQQMTRWEAENPQHRFGTHEYSLERYGLEPSAVEAAFAPYVVRYIGWA